MRAKSVGSETVLRRSAEVTIHKKCSSVASTARTDLDTTSESTETSDWPESTSHLQHYIDLDAACRRAPEDIFERLAEVLTPLCYSQDEAAMSGSRKNAPSLTRFHSREPPGISVAAYLQRLHKYFDCSSECFVLCFIYIERILSSNKEYLSLSSLTVHRILVTALMIAAKYYDDMYYSNSYYSKVGGLRVSEINTLEWQFLSLLKWECAVSVEEYERTLRALIEGHYIECHHMNSN